jgi:hypothetical protein
MFLVLQVILNREIVPKVRKVKYTLAVIFRSNTIFLVKRRPTEPVRQKLLSEK